MYSPNNYSDSKTTRTSSTLGSQLFRTRETTLPNKFVPNSTGEEVGYDENTTEPKPTYRYHTAETSHFSSVSYGATRDKHTEINVDGSKAPLNYYVKAYRPWSASIANENRPQPAVQSNCLARPNSSYEARSIPTFKKDINTKAPVQAFDTSTTVKEDLEGSELQMHSIKTVNHEWGRQMSHHKLSSKTPDQQPIHSMAENFSGNKPSVLAKTTATPISAMYSIENKPTNDNPRPAVLLARQAQTSGVLNSYLPNSSQKNDKITDHGWREGEDSSKPTTYNSGIPKGILRKGSKYDSSSRMMGSPGSYPAYQSAGLARQQWVDGITIGSGRKFSAASLKDSIELTRQSQLKPSETESKSVRWHEVRYNDGTSSALGDVDSPIPKMANTVPAPAQKIIVSRSRPAVKPQPKVAKSPVAKSKPSLPQRGGKGAKGRGGKGRKLKPAKEPPSVIEPHPPEHKEKQLSMSTVVNYSINGDGNKESDGNKATDENSKKCVVKFPP